MSNQEFTQVQSELDAIGYFTRIQKVDKKKYNLIINYEVTLSRKQRRSLKSHVIKLHAEKCPQSLLIKKKNESSEVL